MSPHEADRRHFERQIVYFRPIIIVLAILALLERGPATASRAVSFLVGYLVVAVAVVFLEDLFVERDWHLPLIVDLFALAVFVYLSPYAVPVWFPYLFLCFAAGIRWGFRVAS